MEGGQQGEGHVSEQHRWQGQLVQGREGRTDGGASGGGHGADGAGVGVRTVVINRAAGEAHIERQLVAQVVAMHRAFQLGGRGAS